MWEFTQHAYSLRKWILILLVLAFFASNGGADLHSESCTREQSTKNRQSFNFRKFGNASGLEQCVDFCCRDDTCELAIFSRGFHCYGVSCNDPELCHKILDRLLMEDERQLQRDPSNAGMKDFIRHTSQLTNPRCPKRFVPSFHVLLLGTSTPREFQKLREQSDVGTGQCSAQCCKSRDCLLSFIENEECYGVTRVKAWNTSTKTTQEPRVDLQVAIIDRNKEVSRSLDEEDEDPDDLGSDEGDFKQEVTTQTQSKPKQPELKVKAKLLTSQSNKVSSATNNKTKTNGSNVFKKKGSSQNPARLTIKLHGVQPSVQVNTNRSKGSHKSRIVRPNTTSSPPSKGLSGRITPAAIKSRPLNPIDAIVKLATTHSSSVATPFKSAGPSKMRTVRTKAILLSPSKGLSSHRTPPITKSRALNPIDAIVKLATTYLNSAAKQDERAGPSKAKHTTNVKTTTKRWKTGTKRGIQRIHTKIKHDVKHLKQTTKAAIATVRKPSGANSKAWKTDKIDQGKSYKSFVAKSKSYIPRFTVSVKEGSSQDDEGSVSGDGDLSGDNKDLATEYSDLSGEGTDLYKNDQDLGVKHTIFSREDSDLSGDENGLSGDDIDVGRKHNDFSGDKDLSGEGKDKDSSEINNDLMEDNDGLSGDKEDLRGDSDDQQRTNHREMQQKTYVGEDKEGPTRTKIDLVKDLDELGSDEDVTDQSNKEHRKLSSGKVAKLPQRKHVTSSIPKTTKKKVRDEHIKSKQVKFHPKQAHVQKRKQAASFSSAEFNRPLHGENKLKKDSHISTRPGQSGSERHSVISGRPTSAKRLNESAKNRIGRKATTHHKQTKTIKSTFSTTKNAKPGGDKSSFNRGIKTKGTNKGTETNQSHSIKKDRRFKNGPKPKTKQNSGKSSLSRKTLKVVFSAHPSKTAPKAMQKGHDKAMALSQKTKSKRLKGEVRRQKQVKSKDESSKSESNLENSNVANTNTKHRKSLESGKLQEIQSLQSEEKQLKDDHKKPTKLKNDFKGRQKEGKLKFPNSNSTLEDIGDLMHYAHRKVSLKDKPLNHHIAYYVPTKKRETFGSTAPRQQETTVPKESYSFKNFKANHNETTQGKRPSLHPKLNALQKESKSQGGTTTAFQHPRTESLDKKVHGKLAVHKSLATTQTISSFNHPLLSTTKSEDVPSKGNSYLPTHPGFTTHPRLNNKDRNSSDGNLSSLNNSIFSMKQPSNTNTSGTKDYFLAHFHQADSSRKDGVDFAVKSRGKHHRRRGKQDEAIDVEDLGDADFDIMMSNDIPLKDLPKKGKVKQRYHKHAGKDEEKEHDTKDNDRGRRKKRKKGSSHVKDKEDDTDESERSSTMHHSSHNHKDKSSKKIEKSTTRRHHHHHHHHNGENGDTDKDEDERKEAENESHQHHRKHDKSTNSEEKEGKSENHHHNMHKTHMSHINKGKKDDGDDDDASREETKHQKHHHSDAIKARKEESRKENSEDDETKENRHHHKHKKHYDDNHWEGKIIPGKVKVTYEEDSGKERHHKHHIKDDDDKSEMKKEHHKRKHTSRVHETHSDSDEETDIRKHPRHSKEKALHNHDRENEDEEQRNENHTEDREDDQEKYHFNDEHKKEKQEHAEKRTDVNYEVVKKDRNRLVHNEDNDDDDNESKSKHYDKDNGSDEKQDSEEDEDKAKADEDSNNSENEKHNRVVLGEDSESDEEDEDKRVQESHGHHDSHNRNEHRDNEREDADDDNSNSHEEDHKSVFHNRHEQERHWESKHKHYQSHEESNEADNDDNDDERNNFRKSFIYHKKRKKQRRLKQHYGKEKEREEEYNNDNQEKEFHAKKHHPYDSYKHHRYHYRPRENDNKKIGKYEDGYEPKKTHEEDSFRHDEGENERKYEHNEERMREYQKQHEESEEARFRDHMKEHRPGVELEEHNAKHFHHERQHDGYISHEDDHDRKFEGPPFLHDQQDEYEHRFMGGERPSDDDADHRTYYKKGPKYEPRHSKKSHWKHRHHFHEKEWPDIEGTGGLFDSSAWMRDENSDDDDHGGEGNQEYYRRRHRKHKHRKHRQSYEYWAYGEQNPYYYDYNYYKSRPRYGYYKPRPAFRRPAKWHKYRYGGYDRWKPKPTQWYRDKGHWDRKSPWRSFQESRPTEGYQWQTFSSDRGITNQPKPTAYPRETSRAWPPTNPRWQGPDETQRGFGGDNWPPGHGRGPGKQYNDWSKGGPSALLNQDAHNYQPHQNPPPGLPPSRTFSASKPGSQQQPTGVQSKYVPPAQPKPTGVVSQARFSPTVRRQYAATPLSHTAQVSNQANISQIKNIMDKLNTPSSAVGGQQAGNAPTVNQGPVQNISSKKGGIPKMNLTATDQTQDEKRLNGFFNEENGGKKKSEIVRPTNVSHDAQAAKNSSSSANTSQHVQQTPPRTTNTPAKPPPQTTQVANKTTIGHTTPMQTTSSHTSKPTQPTQNSSTTVRPTQTTATEHTPAAPNFGDVSQSDDSSETGKKHRKHRAPVCIAGKTTDDVTLLRGKKAGNFTNIGDVGDFEMCIKRCCQQQKCDLAFKSAETCFLVNCFSQESCQTSPSLDDIFSPRMCFVRRHSRDDEKESPGPDGDDEWDDKVSPSGIREVCDAEKALGILWKKTIAGRYSAHPCPRGAQGFVKRRCEADSRWLPPDFSECVSKDYQTLFDKSKKLATGADPSPLIRELSQLTTQNIDNSLIFGGDLNRATDIMAAIVQHNGQTELLDMTREDVENFVRASSNLLDMTNQQEWFNIQRNKPGTADVLRSMEMFALQAAMRLPREDMADPTITNNIIIKMDRKSPGDGGLTFPDFSNPRISRWDARHDIIALPSSVFDRGEVSTASISFKSLPYLLPDSNVSTGLGPNSKVISTVLHPHPQEKINPPVTVVLSHIKRRRGNPKCVFWDYTLSPHRGGAWSSRGCRLAFSNHSHSICQCSHLSNFAVLMDLSSDEVSQKEQKRERTMALMWIGIPVLIVGVIGGLYMSFSWNRKSGMPGTMTRPSASLNEKTGLLGQRVVTSQVREEFPASPTRDLYRALSPGYSPTGDLEWQDEFDFELGSGDQGFKQMLLPKLQMLQKHLINEFYDGDKIETKKTKLLESKIKHKSQITTESPVQCDTVQPVLLQTIQHKPQVTVLSPVQPDVVQSVHREEVQPKPQNTVDSTVQFETVNRQVAQAKSQIKDERPLKSQTFRIVRKPTKTTAGRKLRVRFADDSPPGRNLTDEDKERFKRLQRMERRVFVQHLSRWTASSRLNLPD